MGVFYIENQKGYTYNVLEISLCSWLQCWKILVVVCGGLWRQSPTVEEFGVPRLLGNSKAHQQTTWVMNNGIVMRTRNSWKNFIIYKNNDQIIFFQNLDKWVSSFKPIKVSPHMKFKSSQNSSPKPHTWSWLACSRVGGVRWWWWWWWWWGWW